MKITELIVSKYLKKEEFSDPAVLTVKDVQKLDVSVPGEDAKEKGVMFFRERNKGMVLNSTNLHRAARIFGSHDTEDWVGQRVVVYCDDDVEFAGQVIGGLRLRAPSTKKPSPVRETENPAHFLESEL